MASLNDLKFQYYGSLGYTGPLNTREINYWKDASGSTSVQYNDVFRDWLVSLGRTELGVTQKWYAYLRSLGYSGALNSMEYAYFTDLVNTPPIENQMVFGADTLFWGTDNLVWDGAI